MSRRRFRRWTDKLRTEVGCTKHEGSLDNAVRMSGSLAARETQSGESGAAPPRAGWEPLAETVLPYHGGSLSKLSPNSGRGVGLRRRTRAPAFFPYRQNRSCGLRCAGKSFRLGEIRRFCRSDRKGLEKKRSRSGKEWKCVRLAIARGSGIDILIRLYDNSIRNGLGPLRPVAKTLGYGMPAAAPSELVLKCAQSEFGCLGSGRPRVNAPDELSVWQ